jgi:hypothetical protein
MTIWGNHSSAPADVGCCCWGPARWRATRLLAANASWRASVWMAVNEVTFSRLSVRWRLASPERRARCGGRRRGQTARAKHRAVLPKATTSTEGPRPNPPLPRPIQTPMSPRQGKSALDDAGANQKISPKPAHPAARKRPKWNGRDSQQPVLWAASPSPASDGWRPSTITAPLRTRGRSRRSCL